LLGLTTSEVRRLQWNDPTQPARHSGTHHVPSRVDRDDRVELSTGKRRSRNMLDPPLLTTMSKRFTGFTRRPLDHRGDFVGPGHVWDRRVPQRRWPVPTPPAPRSIASASPNR
jgi:hypothetical protein